MDKPILRKLKDMKISKIVKVIDNSKRIANSKAAKAMKKSTGVAGVAKAILNTINPVMWFKKIVVNGTVNIAIKKLCKAELLIVGRECDKVYSKSLFKKDIDENVRDKEKEDIEEIFADDKE